MKHCVEWFHPKSCHLGEIRTKQIVGQHLYEKNLYISVHIILFYAKDMPPLRLIYKHLIDKYLCLCCGCLFFLQVTSIVNMRGYSFLKIDFFIDYCHRQV